MPDRSGKLTELEKQTIRHWLESHWKQPMPCPFCGDPSWVIADHLVQPITLGENQDLMMGVGVGYPQVMIISPQCGYTVLLNAVMLGIVGSDGSEKDAK
jgi:hypothetical protein